jgi:hypothetical protein
MRLVSVRSWDRTPVRANRIFCRSTRNCLFHFPSSSNIPSSYSDYCYLSLRKCIVDRTILQNLKKTETICCHTLSPKQIVHLNSTSRENLHMAFVSPQSDWVIGTKQLSPYQGKPFTSINPNDVPSVYSLMIRLVMQLMPPTRHCRLAISIPNSKSFASCSAITPRPVAFVSTRSSAGVNNLSPFSYFSPVSHDPPIVSIGICANRDGSRKDTLANIEVTIVFFALLKHPQ